MWCWTCNLPQCRVSLNDRLQKRIRPIAVHAGYLEDGWGRKGFQWYMKVNGIQLRWGIIDGCYPDQLVKKTPQQTSEDSCGFLNYLPSLHRQILSINLKCGINSDKFHSVNMEALIDISHSSYVYVLLQYVQSPSPSPTKEAQAMSYNRWEIKWMYLSYGEQAQQTSQSIRQINHLCDPSHQIQCYDLMSHFVVWHRLALQRALSYNKEKT